MVSIVVFRWFRISSSLTFDGSMKAILDFGAWQGPPNSKSWHLGHLPSWLKAWGLCWSSVLFLWRECKCVRGVLFDACGGLSRPL
jgi:hypothetical protein